MEKILLLITILAISCTPVRKSYYANDPDSSPDYKVVKKKQEKKKNDNSEQNSNSDYEEYQPNDYKSNSDIYYPDSIADTINLNDNDIPSQKNHQNSNKSFKSNDPNTEVYSETIIVHDLNNPETNLNIVQNYEAALSLFESGNFTASGDKFRALSETLKENDTLNHETKFYLAECHIAKNEFSQAMDILKKLEKNADKSSEISQKTLVRLGQIYCVLNMKNEANSYYDKLKKSYPNSIYIKVANCN